MNHDEKKKSPSKKETRLLIENKIRISLEGFKEVLGEKEFESRVKKAAKVFAKDFKPASKKAKNSIASDAKTIYPALKKEAPSVKVASKKVAKKK